jgi:WD40 repeat protein/tRNA A-37 threonylcarbamoyl transferase component Bud32
MSAPAPTNPASTPGSGTLGAAGTPTTSYRPAGLPRAIGKFLVLEQLGQGAFGTVYKARDPELSRLVAIKVPRAGAFRDSADEERFLREARAAAQLDHPNIVRVLEVGCENGLPYTVSTFVEGPTLADRLTAGRPDFRTTVALVAQVGDALAYAHDRKVIHRDIKPGNILIDGEGRPHVADFGLARREEEATLTVEGDILGTPAYMSPEQASGKLDVVDGRSDVYALGVVLYELLTGERPFRGNTRMLLHQVLHDDPRPPRKLNDAVPRDLETICLKCLQKEPRRRYAGAGGLADDLRRFADGAPILARPSAAWERALKWARRRPAAAGLLTVSLVALTALVGGALWHNVQLQATLRDLATQRDGADRARADAEARREETRRHLYVARANLAQLAWQDAQVPRVLALLDAQRPGRAADSDLRAFEWHYLRRLCHSELLTLGRGERPDSLPARVSVGFSPDGSSLAVAGGDAAVDLWDARTGRLLHRLEGHTEPAGAVALSPKGERVASGGRDNTVRLWEAATGRLERTLRGHTAGVTAVAFAPDGRRVASASLDATVKVWDAASGQEVRTIRGHGDRVTGVAWSPDGTRLVSACSGANVLRVWDADTGRELFPCRGHEDFVGGVAYSPDGRRLASTSADKTVRLWDAATGQEVLTLRGHAWFTHGVAFSSDGRRLASTSEDRTVKVWDVATGRELMTIRGHQSPVCGVAFGAGDTRLASVGSDGTVKVWDATRPQEALALVGLTQRVTGVVFSTDGLRVAASSEEPTTAVRLWDAVTGRQLLAIAGPPLLRDALAFSADGRRLLGVSRARSLEAWDAATGQPLPAPAAAATFLVAACSADGRRVVALAADRSLGVWDTTTGREVFGTAAPGGPITRLALSRDGSRLAVATGDGTVGVWNVDAGESLCRLRGGWAGSPPMAFSPDAVALATAHGEDVTVWRVATGEQLQTLRGHPGGVACLAYSADGRRLATGGPNMAVNVWDLSTGEQVLTLKGHVSQLTCLAFSPDDVRLASGSGFRDRSVRIWNAVPLPEEVGRGAPPDP